MGRPSWPENAARRYSQLGSPRRHICRHAPKHTGTDSLSTARSIEIPDLGSLGSHSLTSASFRRSRVPSPIKYHRAFAESLSHMTWRSASLEVGLTRTTMIQCARGLSRTRTRQPALQGSIYTAGVPKSCGCRHSAHVVANLLQLTSRLTWGGEGGRGGRLKKLTPPASADFSIQPWSTSICSSHGSCVFSVYSCDILLIFIDL